MTCYNCNKCGRYEYISNFGEFKKSFQIGKTKIEITIRVCKWCLTKAGIKYKIDKDGWLVIK